MSVARPASTGGAVLLIAVLLAAVGTGHALRAFVSLDALAPVMVTLLFGCAGAAAAVALLPRLGRRRAWLDIAGTLAFVGIGISLSIEADQMVRLVGAPEPPD